MPARTSLSVAIPALGFALLTGCLDPRMAAELAQRERDRAQEEALQDVNDPIEEGDPIEEEDPVEDRSGPRVVAHFPTADAAAVSVGASVQVTFDEDLDPSSAGGLVLEGPTGPVGGTAWADGASLRFEPSDPLEPGRWYTVSVTSEVTDAAGNPHEEAAAWDFRTETEMSEQMAYFEADLGSEEWQFFGPFVAAAGDFNVEIHGGGDADLYVRAGDWPTQDAWDCRPYSGTSDEQCSSDAGGSIYVAVHGYSAADIEVFMSWTGFQGFGASGHVGHQEMDRGGVALGAGETVEITTASDTDLDLYIRWMEPVSIDSWDDASLSGSGHETLVFTAPAHGVLYIGLYGYAAADFEVVVRQL